MSISFTVFGTPRPQGSSRAFIPKGWKRPIITSDNAALKPWRQQVSGTAITAMAGMPCIEQHIPVSVSLDFFFQRPKSVKAKKYPRHTRKPDVDKLIRAIFDSLKGIVIHDDSQIICITAQKQYGEPERVCIAVDRL